MKRVLLVLLALIAFCLPAWAEPDGDPFPAGTAYSKLDQARRAAKWLRAPSQLPEGFAFESAEIDAAKKEAWLRYAKSLKDQKEKEKEKEKDKARFSIFQQHTVESKNVPFGRVDGGWYWQDGFDRFLIAGLPEAPAKLVAESVK